MDPTPRIAYERYPAFRVIRDMVRRLNTVDDDFDRQFGAFLALDRDDGANVAAAVAEIITAVRGSGMTAEEHTARPRPEELGGRLNVC